MINLIKIALRNLLRYKRRTILTAVLIVIGVVLVVAASGFVAGFKGAVTGILTDTVLSQIQIHKKGYVDNMSASPLNIYLNAQEMKDIQGMLDNDKNVEAYSPRINFTAMVSNYVETTNIKLTAVYPEKEYAVCPQLPDNMGGISEKERFVKPGEIVIPTSIAKNFSLKIGDSLVVVSTNRLGSMNGVVLTVAGIMTTDAQYLRIGYINIQDALTVLRMDAPEISEVAIRLKNIRNLGAFYKSIKAGSIGGGSPAFFEVHTWEQLTPFASILMLVNIVTYVIRFIMITIVLISIMNIMMMAVYERTKEIGTISAIGAPARRIRGLFLVEGLSLGTLSLAVGLLIGGLLVAVVNNAGVVFKVAAFTLRLNVQMSMADILIITVTVMLVSVLASLQPAFKASRLDPVDALGHV